MRSQAREARLAAQRNKSGSRTDWTQASKLFRKAAESGNLGKVKELFAANPQIIDIGDVVRINEITVIFLLLKYVKC